jgi:integrase
MATINFYLFDRANKKGEKAIKMVYSHNGRKFKVGMGLSILPAQWDEKKQRVKPSYPNATTVNAWLESKRHDLSEKLLDVKLRGEEPDTTTMQKLLKGKRRKPRTVRETEPTEKPKPQGTLLIDAHKRFQQSRKSTHSVAIIKVFETLFSDIAAMLRSEKGTFSLEQIDQRFIERFTTYLLTEKGNTDNTVSKKLTSLKTFLTWCKEQGLYSREFDLPKIKALKKRKALHIALTEAEIRKIEDTFLTEERLQNVRDTFIFGCYTGLRFSDIENLKPENLTHLTDTNGVQHPALRITMVKTRSTLLVPLSPHALAILQKHQFQLPVVNSQKTNEMLKELGQMAGIQDEIQRVRFRGAERIEETFLKWELVSTHTARRTFATISATKGMNLITLQRILGHSSTRQTLDYIKETDVANIEELLRVWG